MTSRALRNCGIGTDRLTEGRADLFVDDTVERVNGWVGIWQDGWVNRGIIAWMGNWKEGLICCRALVPSRWKHRPPLISCLQEPAGKGRSISFTTLVDQSTLQVESMGCDSYSAPVSSFGSGPSVTSSQIQRNYNIYPSFTGSSVWLWVWLMADFFGN